MTNYIAAHEAEYGDAPEVTVSAPGSITVMGSHTEENGGPVLRIAIPRRMWVLLSRRRDSFLRFFSVDHGERKRTSIPNLKYRREDRWANLLKGAVTQVLGLGAPVCGLNVTVGGTVPVEAGLGASAAIISAMLSGLRTLFAPDADDMTLWRCGAGVEQAYFGHGSGLSPFATAFFAAEGYAVLTDERSDHPQLIPLDLGTAVFDVTVAGVPELPRQSAFAARAEECRQGLAVLSRRRRGQALRDYRTTDINEHMGSMSENVRRRCLHVLEEGRRVTHMSQTLMHSQLREAGRLLNHSHLSLRDKYEVSCPEIDWLVKHAGRVGGVYGSRLAAGGFGGSTLTLLEADSQGAYHEVLENYRRIFGFRTESFVAGPSAGVEVRWRENAHTADQR
ncbi:MAG: galactokinase [Spirochaetaceae bacterium]